MGEQTEVLITGVAGFIGSTLAQRILATTDWTVVGVDAITNYYDPTIKESNIAAVGAQGGSRFRLIREDLTKLDLAPVLKNCRYIFHQAGQPGVRASWGSEFDYYTDHNINATQRLLEAAKGAPKLERLVYASSSSVYGDAERYPTLETDLPQPMSPYGVTKLAGELLCNLYGKNFGLPTVSLRYFTVYGPRQRPDMAFHKFIRRVLEKRPIDIYGDGEQIREFTFVDDIVAANILAATATDLDPGTVMNLSGGSSVTVNEVLNVLEEVLEAKIEVNRMSQIPGDVRRTGGDASIANAKLGWVPEIGLPEGIAREVGWFRDSWPLLSASNVNRS